MLFWAQQQLYSLPSHKTLGRERWYRGGREWIFVGLEGVKASEGFIYESDRRVGRVEEEGIVVAAHQPIECC